MRLIIAQILARVLEKWRQSPRGLSTVLIKLRKVWPERGGDTIIITALTIGVFVLFLLVAYIITRF